MSDDLQTPLILSAALPEALKFINTCLSNIKVLGELKEKALKRAGLEEEKVLKLIKERGEARKQRDFSRADQIRGDLTARGIALMDVGTETIWRPWVPVAREESQRGTRLRLLKI